MTAAHAHVCPPALFGRGRYVTLTGQPQKIPVRSRLTSSINSSR